MLSVKLRSNPTCFKPFSKVTIDITKPTKNIYPGTYFLAFLKGSSVFNIKCCTVLNIRKEIIPAINGETTQLETIDITLPQLTASTLIPTAAKPTIAPTIE